MNVNTVTATITQARRLLSTDPNLAIFVVRDLPEVEAVGMRNLAWTLYQYGGTAKEVAAFLYDLELLAGSAIIAKRTGL